MDIYLMTMARKGRKPSGHSPSNYWGDKEEQAVVDYLATDDKNEKNKIYNTVLRPAIDTLIECIIRRYKLFVPDEDYDITFRDASTFIFDKFDKFKPGEYKAYSYYGTICKNYLIARIQRYSKSLEQNPSYDIMEESLNNNIRYSEEMDNGQETAQECIERLIEKIKHMIESDTTMKESEVKLGKALISLFQDWDYILTTDGSYKLNKSAILLFLKDATGMDAKGIRDNMKRFKKAFLIAKNETIE